MGMAAYAPSLTRMFDGVDFRSVAVRVWHALLHV
jgi:hypothetical protein